jgi:hypothetical protein
MKKYFLTILIAFFPFVMFSQVPNNGFESWTNMGTYDNPDQWGTLNDYTASAGVFTCYKGTPGNPGSSYLKLITMSVPGMGIMPGIAVSGALNTTTLKATSGFPYAIRPQSLKGKWQFMAFGSDQGYISVLLSRWNSASSQRDTIAYAYEALPGMVMSWGSFTIPLVYASGADPDSAIIFASASNATGATITANSYLYLDDLAFDGSVAGIQTMIVREGLSVYPNPAGQTLFVKVPSSARYPVLLSIIDNSGKQVMGKKYHTSGGILSADISHLSEGVYFIKLSSGDKVFTEKFLRNK